MENIKKNQVTIDDVEYAFALDQLKVGKDAFIKLLEESLTEPLATNL